MHKLLMQIKKFKLVSLSIDNIINLDFETAENLINYNEKSKII